MKRTRHASDSIAELEALLAGMESVKNPLAQLATVERGHGGRAVAFDGPKTREEHLETLESLSRRLWHMATVVPPEKLRARILMQPDGGASDLRLLADYCALIDLPDSEPDDSAGDEPQYEGYSSFEDIYDAIFDDDGNRT